MNKLEKIKGCLIGGAVGDALGYPIEFLKHEAIIRKFGPNGITDYVLEDGKALISDDTQMTLYTSIGLLNAVNTANNLSDKVICQFVYNSYLDWLKTQGYMPIAHEKITSVLDSISELKIQRSPGNTCLSSLLSGKMGTIKNPTNESCGCGGIMRSAPIAILFPQNHNLSAEITAITHGHPLGYLPSEIFHYIVAGLLNNSTNSSLLEIVNKSIDYISKKYVKPHTLSKAVKFQSKNCEFLIDLLRKAIDLSREDIEDYKSISILGSGFVAHKALAIALYSCLKYENDFEKAVACAVNHDGDSDSTGSIAGNILGAKLGYEKIPEKYIKNLEFHDLICTIAETLHKKEATLTNDNITKI